MAGNSLPKINHALSKIIDLLRLDKTDITSIYIYSFFAGIVSLSLPLGIQSIIGFVMAGRLSTSIVVLIGMVLLATFFNGLLQVKQLELIEKIEQKLFVRYALEYGSRLPKLNIEKLDSYYLPELVNRFFDVSTLQKSIHKLLVDIPTAAIQIVLGTILLAFYHPLFIAFGFFLIFIVIIIIRFTSVKGFATSMETSDYKYKVASWLEEMARSIKSFKYAKKSTLNITNTDKLVNGYLLARTSHFKVLRIQYWSLIAFKLLITAAMLIIGVWLLVNQQINIGQFIAADIVIISIIASIEKLIYIMDQVYEALTSVEKLNKVAEADVETSGSQIFSNKNEGVPIVFENVSFSYDNVHDILSNISFNIDKGDWVLLHGKSGSGKSSVLRLITGAFKNFNGQILMDHIPIRSFQCDTIRDQTGIFLEQQDIFLGTLWDNLTMGEPSITIDEIIEVTAFTGMSEFIGRTEKGLETAIDPIGKRLPTEVKHSILLTRAILGRSRLFLLEEPFRYLNKEQVSKLEKYLKNKQATVIITSQTDQWGEYCNKIINIENGKIVK